MANKQNGEVSIDIDGKPYTLAMTLDAMVALEEMFSTPQKMVTFEDVTTELDKGSAKHLRAVLWSVLQLHHPDVTIKDVSPLVQKAGGLAAMTVKLMQLVKASQADPKDLEALGIKPEKANPQAAQVEPETVGTGANSTSTPVAVA